MRLASGYCATFATVCVALLLIPQGKRLFPYSPYEQRHILAIARPASSETSEEAPESVSEHVQGMLPSRSAIEEVGVRFLDALIKAGQIEMAKGALKTQLKVLRKVNPDQVSESSVHFISPW